MFFFINGYWRHVATTWKTYLKRSRKSLFSSLAIIYDEILRNASQTRIGYAVGLKSQFYNRWFLLLSETVQKTRDRYGLLFFIKTKQAVFVSRSVRHETNGNATQSLKNDFVVCVYSIRQRQRVVYMLIGNDSNDRKRNSFRFNFVRFAIEF